MPRILLWQRSRYHAWSDVACFIASLSVSCGTYREPHGSFLTMAIHQLFGVRRSAFSESQSS